MGSGGSHETQYTYVDNSEREREQARQREQSRLENEREQRRIAEELRIAREKHEEEDKLREKLKKARDEEEEREREKERKRLELEEKLCIQREQLSTYTFGSKIGLASFRGLSIDDVTKLRIGVFGPTGSGKTCFVNTCERAVRLTEKGTAPPSTTGAEGTIIVEDYLPELFFRLVDTRGFFNYNCNENLEFQNILFGKLKPGDYIVRKEDGGQAESQDMAMNSLSDDQTAFADRLHGIIIVVKANDPRLREGALKDYLKPVRDVLRKIGISPITVVTHRDTLKTEEECDDALDEASAATGSSPGHTFFVSNYCKDIPDRNPDTERMIFDILHFALLTAERGVKIVKQQERNKMEDEMKHSLERCNIGEQAPDSPEASVAVFLQSFQKKYQWSKTSVTTVQAKLNADDVTSVRALAMCWGDVQGHFPFGMRKMVEKELRQRNMIP